MSDEKLNWLPIIGICIIALIALIAIGGSSDSNGQFDCSNYQEELHRIANTPEDLIETHRASGVIKQVDENEKYYVVVINPSFWAQTTAEQRQLIRCSTTEIADTKGKEGGIVDPVKNERIY